MGKLTHLFEKNRAWAAKIEREDPSFFSRLALQQSPEYLWIGCSDSRVPATEIVDLMPGEMFVHRNIANLVVHTDLNCLSVIHFAVDILRVKHVIVTGHYGCSGVRAAFERAKVGLSNNWLRHLEDVRQKHQANLDRLPTGQAFDRLCEVNVIEQVDNVCQTSIVRDAWDRGQDLTVHGWIYGLKNGLVRDLEVSVTSYADAARTCSAAIAGLG